MLTMHSPLVLRRKFHPEILTGSPWTGASNKGGVGKTSYFLALCVNTSKTVRNTTRLMTNRNLHVGLRLAPIKVDDLVFTIMEQFHSAELRASDIAMDTFRNRLELLLFDMQLRTLAHLRVFFCEFTICKFTQSHTP